MTDDPLLTGPQIAGRLGISTSTWRGYVHRGLAPAPDDPDDERAVNRRQPRWRQSTVDRWQEGRRGQAWRKGDLALRRPPSGEERDQ